MFELIRHLLIRYRIWLKAQKISLLKLKLNLFWISLIKTRPTALIIKTDAIGDYLLIRNYFILLKSDPFYKKFKWVLIVGSELQSFIDKFDDSSFDEIYYLDKQKFTFDEAYKQSFLTLIRNLNASLVINTLYSREKNISEKLVSHSNAMLKVATVGAAGNISIWEKNLANLGYDYLIPSSEEPLFEFYRNSEIFKFLGFKNYHLIKYELSVKNTLPILDLAEYCVLSPFSKQDFKIIPQNIIKSLFKKIALRYKNILLLCGPLEIDKENQLYQELLQYNMCNLIKSEGKYTLEEVVKIINESHLLITADSMNMHIAAALKKKFIVFWKGDHYGRFLPYPDEIFNNYTMEIPESLKNMDTNQRYSTNKFTNNLSMEDIILKI